MNKTTVLVTGGQGFIGSAVCQEFLDNDYHVISIDNYSKYGYIERPHDNHPNFQLIKEDAKKLNEWCTCDNVEVFSGLHKVDYIVHCAASIGGISFFHANAFDLLAENMRLDASVFDCAIDLFQNHQLKRIVALASSMIMDMTDTFPTSESDIPNIPPPPSSYGFSKLGTMYFAKAACEQYKLPYTIINPWNACGIGEEDFRKGESSHVIPDLIMKTLSGQKPLKILGDGNQIRTFTSVRDIAKGIRLSLESNLAENEIFNIANPNPIKIKELAEIIWNKLRPNEAFEFKMEQPFKYDTLRREPDVSKAKELLGFEAKITLDESIDEVIEYIGSCNV